jgi:Domain of unknown function (DUF5615)
VVQYLRSFGHDVLTVQEAGNRGLSDEDVVRFATLTKRVILTLNRRHFVKLHHLIPDHMGILVCFRDDDWQRQANRIHELVLSVETFHGKLFRVNRPR